MSEDALVGMEMNIPALEAADDLRELMLIGSLFAGRDGRDYIEFLQETAWMDDPEARESGEDMLNVAEAKKNRPVTPKAENPQEDLSDNG